MKLLSSGMLYPVSVIDGLVHQLGGLRLQAECSLKWKVDEMSKCPVGHAVMTSPGGSKLRDEYDAIIHTVPPFYAHYSDDPVEALRQCYQNAFALAFSSNTPSKRIASPLLGAGCRGFPVDAAINVAASESVRWRDKRSDEEVNHNVEEVVAFGVLEHDVAEKLVHSIGEAIVKF